jgi:pilus assembly protein Flp/PilA
MRLRSAIFGMDGTAGRPLRSAKLLPGLLRDRRGATAIEYAMLATLIAVAAMAAFANLGGQVHNTFNEVNEKVGTRP